MYTLLGISLSLALLLIVNLLVALVASFVWNAVSRLMGSAPAVIRAQVIFGLRILPVAAALILVAGFVIPAYVLYEPYSTGEVVSFKMAALAVVSSLGFGFALYRVFRTFLATRKLISEWLRSAEKMSVAGINVPLYRFEHRFPVVAVVGVFRPRIFVADRVIEVLDEHEFRATLAHEAGHLAASDNLKRGLLRICRDLSILPFGKRLDDAWSDNAEAVADEFASSKYDGAALNLASALVKIAKLIPNGTYPAMPAGAFLIDEQVGDVSSRVRRLLSFGERKAPSAVTAASGLLPFSLACAPAIFAVAVLPFVTHTFLSSTHVAIETFVRILQ